MTEIEMIKQVVELGFLPFALILIYVGQRRYHALLDRFLKHLEDYHIKEHDKHE